MTGWVGGQRRQGRRVGGARQRCNWVPCELSDDGNARWQSEGAAGLHLKALHPQGISKRPPPPPPPPPAPAPHELACSHVEAGALQRAAMECMPLPWHAWHC